MSARANQSKPKAVKKPASRSAKAAAAGANAKTPQRSALKTKKAFYFVAGDDEPRITDKKPAPGARVLQFSPFEKAKDQAVEQLIDLIDRCERRLWDTQRSENFEQDLRRVGKD
jgi:hypothetical protein